MRNIRVVVVVVIAMVGVACTEASEPSGSAGAATSTAPTSTTLATNAASAPIVTPKPTPTPSSDIVFRALDTPADYGRSSAEAVHGTTAVGWVQVGIVDEQPAVWDTTTGALRVLDVPAEFVHPNGDTFVRLVGVSGTTAVGTGILGTGDKRGQTHAMAWDITTGGLRILDIPADFTDAEAHAISGTTAVGQAWTAHGEVGAPVAWDTETGAVRTLPMPTDYCGNPQAISGETVVGTRCFGDVARSIVWNPLTADARDLDLLPGTEDGIPRAVDGTTAVGECCFGEEGTPLPLIWDTATGSVRQLALPAPFVNGGADGVSGTVVVGSAGESPMRVRATPLLWDLESGDADILPAPAGYDEEYGVHAVSGHTIVGSACPPPPSTSENPRCVAAAWTLP